MWPGVLRKLRGGKKPARHQERVNIFGLSHGRITKTWSCVIALEGDWGFCQARDAFLRIVAVWREQGYPAQRFELGDLADLVPEMWGPDREARRAVALKALQMVDGIAFTDTMAFRFSGGCGWSSDLKSAWIEVGAQVREHVLTLKIDSWAWRTLAEGCRSVERVRPSTT